MNFGSEEIKTGSNNVFDAFISYSHEDVKLAEKISRRIRTYRPPRALKLPARKLLVFRDVERLTTTPDLSGALIEKIDASKQLILLASPSAAKSDYVEKELKEFIARRGKDRLLLVLCSGDPENSFPPTVRKLLEEPLYIDLRPRKRYFSNYRHFRSESLRLIAALLKVDYSELRREDEMRRRRRRFATFLTLVLSFLAFFCVWMIAGVPAHTWILEPLPQRVSNQRVLPVQQIAVSRQNPMHLLFYVRGATYASQRPKRSWAIHSLGLCVSTKAFMKLAEFALKKPEDLEEASEPFAVINFTPTEPKASCHFTKGQMRLYGFWDSMAGKVRFHRSLKLDLADRRGQSIVIGAMLLDKKLNPFELDSWIDDPRIQDLFQWCGQLRGTIHNRLDNSKSPAKWEVIELGEPFGEASQRWLKDGIVSNRSEPVELDGLKLEPQELEYLGGASWKKVLESREWNHYQPPIVKHLGHIALLGLESRERTFRQRQEELEAWLASDFSLKRLIDKRRREWSRFAATVVTRKSPGWSLSAARVISSYNSKVAHLRPRRGILFLLRNGRDSDWFEIKIPNPDAMSTIHDVVPLDETGERLLLVGKPLGIVESRDRGRSWADFNAGQPKFREGRSVKVVPAGSRPVIYALVDIYGSSGVLDQNRLYRHHVRRWIERLRLGLIGLLEEEQTRSKERAF
jgi:hypothetical protein